MDTVWNAISHSDQAHVLQLLGMDRLPDPSAMNASQLAVLAGIVGSVAADTIQRSSIAARSAPTLAAPELAVPAGGVDWTAIMLKVAEVQAKMKETQMKFSAEELEVQKSNLGRANKEYLEKIEEHIREMRDAEEEGFWGELFGWIVTALTVFVAVVASVASGAVVVPLVVAAAITVGMQVLEATGAWDKMLDALTDLLIDGGCQSIALLLRKCLALDLLKTIFGMTNPSSAGDWFADFANSLPFLNLVPGRDPDPRKMTREEIKGILSMAVMVVIMVVTMRATASSGAFRGGKDLSKSGDLAVAAAEGASSLSRVQRIAKYATIAGVAGMSGAAVGGGVVSILQGVTTRDALEAQAEAKEIAAWLARLNQFMDEESERLQKVMEQLNSGFAEISDMISGMSSAQIRISQSL